MNWDSEMLYNVYSRTFDLTDVTGVMNICDRHMGAIAMRVSCFVICLSTFAVRVCIRLGSLAIAAASAYDPSTCEGPPTEYNPSLPLTPDYIESEICRGCSIIHLVRASTRH